MEWLEPDGLGGFASGTVSTIRTRRYHALLLVARRPPADRVVLVNGIEAWIEEGGERRALTSQRYAGGVVHPNGAARIEGFDRRPWPTWRFPEVVQEIFVPHRQAAVVLRWTPRATIAGRLVVRPLVSGRDFHALFRESDRFGFGVGLKRGVLELETAGDLPPVRVLTSGDYTHRPEWYRRFMYEEETARGLDDVEDLASPGLFTFDLGAGPAVLVLAASNDAEVLGAPGEEARAVAMRLAAGERRRRDRHHSDLERAARAYVVRRGEGHTVLAGYPWFGDWGRDTFIALRGLRETTGGAALASSVLCAWAPAVSEDGLLPNRFADGADDAPEYNAVDAALWYVLAVFLHLDGDVREDEGALLLGAVERILDGYSRGARHGIRADDDGLLAAGEPGVQVTWMDAKVGDRVVTPRIGKPVEVQALWLNALDLARRRFPRFAETLERGRASFVRRFVHPERAHLADVVDVDHVAGTADWSLRPNQILAVGALPLSLVDAATARRVVDVVERSLWTPMGLRSLGPGEPGYARRYEGGVGERDGAYHQGTVWPWLIGPFVDAYVSVHGNTPDTRHVVVRRFLAPLIAHLEEAGLGHVSELADAEPPHAPKGAPFQAWSVTELFRLRKRYAPREG